MKEKLLLPRRETRRLLVHAHRRRRCRDLIRVWLRSQRRSGSLVCACPDSSCSSDWSLSQSSPKVSSGCSGAASVGTDRHFFFFLFFSFYSYYQGEEEWKSWTKEENLKEVSADSEITFLKEEGDEEGVEEEENKRGTGWGWMSAPSGPSSADMWVFKLLMCVCVSLQ